MSEFEKKMEELEKMLTQKACAGLHDCETEMCGNCFLAAECRELKMARLSKEEALLEGDLLDFEYRALLDLNEKKTEPVEEKVAKPSEPVEEKVAKPSEPVEEKVEKHTPSDLPKVRTVPGWDWDLVISRFLADKPDNYKAASSLIFAEMGEPTGKRASAYNYTQKLLAALESKGVIESWTKKGAIVWSK